MSLLLRLLTIVTVYAVFSTQATAADLHRVWEDRCTQCHDEAGDFARQFLVESEGRLYGSQPNRDVREFLHNHYLVDEEVDRVYAMLLAQVTSGMRFKNQCGGCHAKAAELVRENSDLLLAKSRQPVREFLRGHGGIKNDEEFTFFLDLLNRLDQEIRGQ